jgi:hypothetical protein
LDGLEPEREENQRTGEKGGSHDQKHRRVRYGVQQHGGDQRTAHHAELLRDFHQAVCSGQLVAADHKRQNGIARGPEKSVHRTEQGGHRVGGVGKQLVIVVHEQQAEAGEHHPPSQYGTDHDPLCG